MTRPDADRNLLFGVLALHLDLIDGRQFAEACSAWAGNGEAPLAEYLLRRGWVTADDREAIEHVIRRKLSQHGGDVHRALAAVADARVAAPLAGVQDPGIIGALSGLATDPGVTPPAISTLDWPADSRGAYPLVKLHGRGGLGRVWLAHDPGIGRSVALKELLPGRADDPGNRSRFVAEARITGQLQHPGIVPVYELSRGEGDDRPFYTMRMVRGRTLSQAIRDHHARRRDGCRGESLELSGLLDAFIAVCNAIAYAHSRGVIHRDLKGPNIILGDYGEAIVLDWGLAKLVGRPEGDWPESAVSLDEDGRAATLEGQAVGTPGYMAPEQADGRCELVGPSADIYGLGAVLYEILTGRPPHPTGGTPEAVRQVCERDPEPPHRVCPATPRALEAVCLKALSRRREDRYASATELADDVRRYLADEPVSAWREPMAARASRWGRRHRSAVIVAAGFLMVGVAGQAAALVVVGRERARAEAHFRLAREGANEIYYEILDDPLLDRPGMDLLRRKIIERVRAYFARLVANRPGDPELRRHLGWSHLTLGREMSRTGEADGAVEEVGRARAIFERLAADHPAVEAYRDDTAAAHFEWGEILRGVDRLPEAESQFAAAARVWSAMGPRRDGRPRPQLATCYDSLGSVELARRRPDDALTWHMKALGLRVELARGGDPDTLSRLAFCRLSIAAARAGREEWDQAEESSLEAVGLLEAVIARRADDAGRSRLARALEGLGDVYARTERTRDAAAVLSRTLGIWQALDEAHPTVVENGENRARIHRLLGELYDPERHGPGDARRAEREYGQSAAFLEGLRKRVPASERPTIRARLATALERLARLHRARGDEPGGADLERRARKASECREGATTRDGPSAGP